MTTMKMKRWTSLRTCARTKGGCSQTEATCRRVIFMTLLNHLLPHWSPWLPLLKPWGVCQGHLHGQCSSLQVCSICSKVSCVLNPCLVVPLAAIITITNSSSAHLDTGLERPFRPRATVFQVLASTSKMRFALQRYGLRGNRVRMLISLHAVAAALRLPSPEPRPKART